MTLPLTPLARPVEYAPGLLAERQLRALDLVKPAALVGGEVVAPIGHSGHQPFDANNVLRRDGQAGVRRRDRDAALFFIVNRDPGQFGIAFVLEGGEDFNGLACLDHDASPCLCPPYKRGTSTLASGKRHTPQIIFTAKDTHP